MQSFTVANDAITITSPANGEFTLGGVSVYVTAEPGRYPYDITIVLLIEREWEWQ